MTEFRAEEEPAADEPPATDERAIGEEPAARPETPAEPRRSRGGVGRIVAGIAVAAVLGVALWIAVVALTGGSRDPEVFRYEIPAGTGARLDAGETVQIVPSRLEMHRGDRLVIVNDDDRAHIVGPVGIRAGETLDHTFDQPGRYVGECSVHPGGEIEIVVT